MKTLNLVPGSKDWLEFRSHHFTASEASALMGCNPAMSRADLLKEKYSAFNTDQGSFVNNVIFENGHKAEAAVRPAIEADLGDEFYPATVVDDNDWLSASLDGINIDGSIIWEHKQYSREKVLHIAETGTIPPRDRWQVMQQLMITGAEKCKYSVGNEADDYVDIWVTPDQEDFKTLRAAWDQFESDLKEYQPPQVAKPVIGTMMSTLPPLRIQVTGEVTASNLAEYRDHALDVLSNINTDLQTDQDFADAKQTVKWLKSVEQRLDAVKDAAMSQTISIDNLFRSIDDIKASACQRRKALDSIVKERAQTVRINIRDKAEHDLDDHMTKMNKIVDNRFPVPVPDFDFVGAMKNKKTIKSLHDAVDQALANAKVVANESAYLIKSNLVAYDKHAADYSPLFPDLHLLITKQTDDFLATVKMRIADQIAKEQREKERREAEAARIRAEEQRKAEAEASAPQITVEANQTAFPSAPAVSAPAVHDNPVENIHIDEVDWSVTCVFYTGTDEDVTAEELETEIVKVLEATNIGDIQSIKCEIV